MTKIIVILIFLWAATCEICYLPTTYYCNETDVLCPGATDIAALSDTLYNCPQALQLEASSISLMGTFTALNLTASAVTVSNLTVYSFLYVTALSNISMEGQVSAGGSIMIRSNLPNTSQSNSSSQIDMYETLLQISAADIKCLKMTVIGMRIIIISSSLIETVFSLCLYSSINVKEMSTNTTEFIYTNDVTSVNQLDFAVFLLASELADLQDSVVRSVSIAVIVIGNINMSNSTLNASGQSCKSNNGIGRGTTIQYQNTYCTSGSSSCGYGSLSNPDLCSDIVQYFMFLSHSFPYINKGPYLSTGSGGYGYTSANSQSGAGGGIVFILADQNYTLNASNVLAAGGNVEDETQFISAGSGGTVFITSQYLIGISFNEISVAGGNCSNNNGSGGGGVVKITFEDIPMDSLWVNINEGNQGNDDEESIYSNGIFYGPTCPLGEQAYYLGCQKCPNGTYSGLGDPICLPCPPISQLDFKRNSLGNKFIYQCYQIQDSAQITTWLTPGDISLWSILLYFALLLIFTIIGAFLKKKIKKEKLVSVDDFRIEDIKRDIEKAKILALELRQSQTIKPHELMYHVHRISCFGTNSEESPWVLPLAVPQEVQKYVHQKVFKNFAESFNEEARWTNCEYYLAKLSCLVYPLYWYYLDKVKHRKFQKLLAKFEHAKDYNLLNNHDYQDRSILTIKFSKNKDYTNCYLDFFVYERADTRYFTLTSPFLIHLSGEGNFLRPYYLEQEDPFFRMMFFVVNRNLKSDYEGSEDEKSRLFSNMVSYKRRQANSKQLARFLRKLNTLACTLDLSAPTAIVAEVLWNLQELIQKWNREFFNSMAVQVDLLFMISRLLEGSIIGTDVQMATHKNRQTFKSSILEKIKQSSQYQHTLKIALFVYNPEQEIPRDQDQELITQEYEDSLEGIEDSMRETLVQALRVPEGGAKGKRRTLGKIGKLMSQLRYYLLSHQKTHYDEYTIKFLQSLFILMQTMLAFIWSIKLELPYVFVNLACPFIGIIWFVSDSYGFGKLYLILAAMTLLDDIVSLVMYSTLQAILTSGDLMIRTVVCSIINILIVSLMIFIGKRAITLSKKLSLKKEEDPHKKD